MNLLYKRIAKNLLQLALLIVVSMSCMQDAKATHIVGGEMNYRCLGNNQYEITLYVYRDCFFGDPEAYFDSLAFLGVYDSKGFPIDTIGMEFMMVDDTLSEQLNDPCLFVPLSVCVHTTVYRDTITLDPNMTQEGYTLAYQRCCRNGSIVNIEDPISTGATFSTFISIDALLACNNGAEFGDWPPVYICSNKLLDFDHSATDLDGDSLVYSLCTPYAGGTLSDGKPEAPGPPPYDTVVWQAPLFGLSQILGPSTDLLSIDPQTGQLTAIPTITGQFVVGVCVQEYRDGILLGETRRDFQFNIGNCGAPVAAFAAPETQCENLEVEFENLSQENDDFRWYFLQDGVAFDSTDIKDPTYIFPDTGTYEVMLVASVLTDCRDTFTQTIKLVNNRIDADYDIQSLQCGDTTLVNVFDRSSDPDSDSLLYEWTLITVSDTFTSTLKNPSFLIPATMDSLTLIQTVTSANGCSVTDEFRFMASADDPSGLLADTLSICIGETVSLNPDFLPDFVYLWSPDTFLLDTVTTPNPRSMPTEDITYTLMITDSSGFCMLEEMVTVTVSDLVLDYNFNYSCDGLTVNFENTSQDGEAYIWNFNDPASSNDISMEVSPSYTYNQAGTYTVVLVSQPSAPCQVPDTLSRDIVVGEPIARASFDVEYDECDENGATLLLTSTSTVTQGTITEYEWRVDGNVISTLATATYNTAISDSLDISLEITTSDTCVSTAEMNGVPVILVTDNGLPDSLLSCLGEQTPLWPTAPANLMYSWSPNITLSDPAIGNPLANPSQSTTYTVTITAIGVDTCQIVREVFVQVNDGLDIGLPADTSTCETSILLDATVTGGVSYEWTDATGAVLTNLPTVTLSPDGTELFIVTVIDELGCSNVDSIMVSTGRLNLQFDDPLLLCVGTTDQIVINNVGSGDILTFSWEPASEILAGGTTNMPTISVATPGVRTFYFNAENQFGCNAEDSIVVVVVDTTAGAEVIQNRQCEPLIIEFTNTSPFADFYVWDFGVPGATATGSMVSYEYPAPGTYTVSLFLPGNNCQDTISKEIEVLGGVVIDADFGFEYDLCSANDVLISFSDSSFHASENIVSWRWLRTNGVQFSTQQNPSFTFNDDQLISVTLIVESESGCVDTLTQMIGIADVPEIDIPDTLLTCDGVSASLNPNGDPLFTYEWTPAGPLDDATAANPSASVSVPTDFFVTITVPSGSDVCVFEDSVSVDIGSFADVVAMDDFTTCEQQVTISATVNINTAINWFDLNNDSIGTGTSIMVNPQGPSTYIARAFDSIGCFDEDTVVVTGNAVDASLSDHTLSLCQFAQATVTVNNSDPTDILTINWTPSDIIVGSSSANPVVIQADIPGTYVIYADVSNQFGCTWRDSVTVTVAGANVTAVDDFISCMDSVFISAITNVGAPIMWYDESGTLLGTGPGIRVAPDGFTTYIARSENANGCTGEDTVVVGGFKVEAELSADSLTVCQSDDVQVELINLDLSQTLSITWSPVSLVIGSPNANPVTINTVNPGEFELYVNAANDQGCSFIDTVEIDVIDNSVTFDFDYTVQCDGRTVVFENKSTVVNSFIWNFGDNSPISTEVNPTHTYPSTGNFVVSLTSPMVASCIDTLMRTILVPDTLVDADFEVSYVDCSPDQVTVLFEETSTNPLNDIVKWEWYFGNNLASTDSAFERTFTNNTTLNISLIVETVEGCRDTVARTIRIELVPEVSLPDTVIACRGVGAFLNPTPTAGVEYLWSPSTGLDNPNAVNPFATPNQTTTYTVIIRKITADTCERVEEVVVFVPDDLPINMPMDETICDKDFELTGTSTGAVVFEWLNGDGTVIDTANTITVQPMNSTIYIARVTDEFGCTSQDSVTIVGRAIDIDVPDEVIACDGDSAIIDIINLDPSVDINNYVFTPANVVLEVIDNERVIIKIDTAGTIDFCIKATNQFNCETTECVRVSFNDTTGLAGSLNYGQCEPNVVRFLSTHPQADRLIWNFGDPANPMAADTGSFVTYTYANNGSYNVTVTLEGPEECSADIILPIEVVDGPYFDLGYEMDIQSCDSPSVILFTDTSSHVQDNITSWEWIFTTGDTISGPNAQIEIEETQKVGFTVNISSVVGCEAMYSDEIDIEVLNIRVPDSLSICLGEAVNLYPEANPDYDYAWSPSSAFEDPTVPNPSVSPETSTDYSTVITALLMSGDTCIVERDVNVEVFPVLEFEAPVDLVFCDSTTVELEVEVQNSTNVMYEWSLDPDFGSVISDTSTVTAIAGRPNLYYLRLTDQFECVYIDTVSVANYEPGIDIMQDTFMCDGEQIILSAENNVAGDRLSYFWEPGNGIISGEETSSPAVSPDSSIVYYVEYSNQFGCVGLDSILVEVRGMGLNDAVATATPDTISFGRTSRLETTLDIDYTYEWFPANSLTRSDVRNPIAKPDVTTDYEVIINSNDGCSVMREVTVTVVMQPCIEPFIFVPRAFSPNDDGVNDMLFVYGNPIDELLFIVYNRWGEEMFRTTDIRMGWDGTFKGNQLPPDVYGFYLEVRCFGGEEFFKKGNTTLVR